MEIYTNTPVSDRSGTATTTSSQLAAANPTRRGLDFQNVGQNPIGINEFGSAAAIGSPGTWTVNPGNGLRIRTSFQINVISSGGTSAFTAVEW